MLREYFGEADRRTLRPLRFLRGSGQRGVRSRARPTSATTCTRPPIFTPASAAASGARRSPSVPRSDGRRCRLRRGGCPPRRSRSCHRRSRPSWSGPRPTARRRSTSARCSTAPEAGQPLAGDAVVDGEEMASWRTLLEAAAEVPPALPTEEDFESSWSAVRDANIRPYVEWTPSKPVSLPALVSRPQQPPSSRPRAGGGGPPPKLRRSGPMARVTEATAAGAAAAAAAAATGNPRPSRVAQAAGRLQPRRRLAGPERSEGTRLFSGI